MKKTILIIEQEVNPSNGLKTILEKEDYKVFSAYGPYAIHEALEGHEPALAIINLGVSKRLGLNILSKTKKDFPGVPIMVMPVNSHSFSARELERIGAEDCIAKPLDVQLLKKTVADLIKGK